MTRKAVFHDAGTYDDGGSPLTLGGVSSVAKSGDTELTGDVTFSEGTNVTLTQSGNDIEIASSGGGGGIGAVLFDSTLGSDTANIDTGAGGIAGGYHFLQAVMLLRTDEAGAVVNVDVTLNNDAGANYDYQYVLGAQTTVAAASGLGANAWVLTAHGSGGAANYASAIQIMIPDYTGTTFYKTAMADLSVVDTSAPNQYTIKWGLGYRSTSAVTRMKVAAQGAAKLKTGSRLTIVGF